MKKDIHPEYHRINIVMTDGTSYELGTTMGKAGDTLRLDVDPKTHPAWTGGGQRIDARAGRLADFNKRYANFGAATTTGEKK